MANELETRAINVIRGLAMDAVQKANSGHPGTAMALAPLAHVLYTRVMRYDAAEPDWPDRDRFILSAGHASMLLYSMLLPDRAFGLTLDDLKAVPAVGLPHARPPGVRPHARHRGDHRPARPGVRQRRRHGHRRGQPAGPLRRRRVRPPHLRHLLRRRPLGGHQPRGRLARRPPRARPARLRLRRQPHHHRRPDRDRPQRRRRASASRPTAGTSSRSARWRRTSTRSRRALREGMAEEDRPSLIILRSHIGYPSPKFTDTPKAHGEPLGAEEIARVKEILGMPAEDFWVPDDVLDLYREAGRRGAAEREAWAGRLEQLRAGQPELAEEFEACLAGRGRPGWEQKLPSWPAGEPIATRVACADALNAIAGLVPGLIGGGADLTGNTGTKLSGFGVFSPEDRKGRQLYFGVREHAMGSAMNGMALHGGALPFGGTFLIFSDYMRGRRPPGRPGAGPHRLRLVARLGRPRRGRPDAPADRAPRLAAGHPGPAGHPPGRRQRDVAGVAGPHQFRRAQRLHPLPPEAARPRGDGRAGRGRRRPGRLRPRRRARRPRPRAHRDRVRGRRSASRPRRPWRGRASRSGSCRCRAGSCSSCCPTSEQAAVLPPGGAHAGRRGGRHLRLGALRRRHRGPRPVRGLGPGDIALENLGFTPQTSPTGPGPCSPPAGGSGRGHDRCPPGVGGATAERSEQP